MDCGSGEVFLKMRDADEKTAYRYRQVIDWRRVIPILGHPGGGEGFPRVSHPGGGEGFPIFAEKYGRRGLGYFGLPVIV